MPIPMKPVEDSIDKVNDEIAVGSDLGFQRRWWRFERIVWTLFAFMIVADLLGFFGRGYFAKAEAVSPGGNIRVTYERIERSATPSIMRVQFASGAVREGKVHLVTSESLINELGTQRVIPQPEASVIGAGTTSYTFAAHGTPASVEFQLQPPAPGIYHLSAGLRSGDLVTLTVYVLP